MPKLIDPTAEQLAETVKTAIGYANAMKHSPNRMLDAEAVTPLVVEAVAKSPAGALDCHGGTHASRYPATTVALAVAWYTTDGGTKIVRVRCERVRLASAAATVDAPFATGKYSEGLIAAGGFPVLVDGRLRAAYVEIAELLKAAGPETVPMAAAVYAAPGDLTAWLAYCDWCDEEHGDGDDTKRIRDAVAGVNVRV